MFYELMEKTYKMEKEGARIVKLNIGDTGLPTPVYAMEALENFIHYRKAEYVPAAGIPELREKIAKREGCKVENVVVGSGSKLLIYGLLSILAKPGNRVVFPSPYWPAYVGMCQQLGIDPDVVRTSYENNWNFVNLYPRGAKAIIICNPLNPTSTIYPSELIENLIYEANRSGVHVIIDEAYKGIAFKEIPRFDKAIRVRSFSKEFNMEGWRLAYVVAPEEIVNKLISFLHVSSTCTPPFIQWAGLECLEHEKEILGRNIRTWKQRLDFAMGILEPAGFCFVKPEAGVYIFATHDKIDDAAEYSSKLLDMGIAVSPGIVFGDSYRSFIRISLNQPDAILQESFEKMKKCLE
jgi:aspartate/methionine/tyrosine aminotransferase